MLDVTESCLISNCCFYANVLGFFFVVMMTNFLEKMAIQIVNVEHRTQSNIHKPKKNKVE